MDSSRQSRKSASNFLGGCGQIEVRSSVIHSRPPGSAPLTLAGGRAVVDNSLHSGRGWLGAPVFCVGHRDQSANTGVARANHVSGAKVRLRAYIRPVCGGWGLLAMMGIRATGSDRNNGLEGQHPTQTHPPPVRPVGHHACLSRNHVLNG